MPIVKDIGQPATLQSYKMVGKDAIDAWRKCIHIPVNLVFPINSWRSSEVTFKKTYVFILLNGRWQLQDIISSGRETPIPGTLWSADGDYNDA